MTSHDGSWDGGNIFGFESLEGISEGGFYVKVGF